MSIVRPEVEMQARQHKITLEAKLAGLQGSSHPASLSTVGTLLIDLQSDSFFVVSFIQAGCN